MEILLFGLQKGLMWNEYFVMGPFLMKQYTRCRHFMCMVCYRKFWANGIQSNPYSTIQSIRDTGTSEPDNVTQDSNDLIPEQQGDVDTSLWCYCRKPENEEMIACDYPGCSIEWFHITCLKLQVVPKGRWYCPDCRKKFKGRHPPKH